MEDFDVEALRRGDTQAFSSLVRRYHRILLSVARGMVGADEAEAIVQESWLKAYQAISGFEGRAKLRTWLTTIVMNEARMHLRKQPHREVRLSHEAVDGFDDLFDRDGHWLTAPARWHAPGPEDAMRAEQFGQCLARLLDALPPQQRLVLELRDIQQRELTEIAALLQIAEGNVRVLLHRARARVYRGIEHYEEHGQC
jgi:RNA polymerase sigma-70 factor, ECF subfamily